MNRRKFVRSLAAGTVATTACSTATAATPGTPTTPMPDARLTTTPLVLQDGTDVHAIAFTPVR